MDVVVDEVFAPPPPRNDWVTMPAGAGVPPGSSWYFYHNITYQGFF